MKRLDPRILIGALLILAGALGFLQAFGFLRNASDIFWGLVFLAAGVVFLFVFVRDFTGGNWWAAFPGFVLTGLGVMRLLPDTLNGIRGPILLGAIGLSFWAVYLAGPGRWWAIIPGGVLFTLAVVSALPEELLGGAGTGGIFFLGLALTFLLVALLADMHWAYWPAGALAVFGALLFFTSQSFLLSYIAAGALILVGVYIVWRSVRSV